MISSKLWIKLLLRGIAVSLILFASYYLSYAVGELINNIYPLWARITIIIQLIIEAFAFFQSAFMILAMSNSVFKKEIVLKRSQPEVYPTLDVYIPIRYVKAGILEETVIALVKQDYPKERLTIFIADDTPDEKLSMEYQELCKKYDLEYVYEPKNVNYKSGMMNLALPKGNGEYIAYFDYDQIPLPGILKTLVEILIMYPDSPFIQAKKRFKNLHNLSRIWSALLYVQFFEVLEQTKMDLQTVLFAGSTACFRRSILEEVGGIPEKSFTEDNELSTVLMLNGYHGIFTDTYGSEGTVPDGFRAQISQLWRWSQGGAHILHIYGKSIIKSPRLKMNQKLDIISMIIITPSLVLLYMYVFSFYPLLIGGINSPRFEIGGISSLAYMLIGPIFTYALITAVSLYRVKQNNSEFKMSQLPAFLVIGLTANTLGLLGSGALGIFGKYGPKSKRAKWTMPLPLIRMSIVAFLIGVVMVATSSYFLSMGLSSAIILLLTGISFLPTPFITLYYINKI